MLIMQPVSITADSTDEQGATRYLVKFVFNGKDVDYAFLVDKDGLSPGEDFMKATIYDPFAPVLCQSILKFHQARQVGAEVGA